MLSIILFCCFVAVIIGIGVWGLRKTTNIQDFLLGGRSVGPWVSAFSFCTSYFSAVLFIGFAGKLGWGFGLDALWIAVGNALAGGGLAWLVLGRRTRRMTHALDAMTMPEFFEKRYESTAMKIVAAVIVFIFLLPYSASVFKGLGHLFEADFGIPYTAALLLMTALSGVYLCLGGYFGMTLTDFVQGLVMLVGSLLMVLLLTGEAGGVSEAIGTVREQHVAHVGAGSGMKTLVLVSLVFMTSFGTWGLPQMVQKFYAISDGRLIPKAALVTTVFALVVVSAAYFTGALEHVFFDAPVTTDGKADFDRMIPDMLSDHLPEWLMAVMLLLIFSASMSTLSALTLVSSSAVAVDVYKVHLRNDADGKKPVRVMRMFIVVFVLISFGLAVLAERRFQFIIDLMSMSWGTVAGAFMAPFLYGLFWRRTTRAGAFAGMLTGPAAMFLLTFLLGKSLLPVAASAAMLIPFAVVPAVSLFTSPPTEATVERAFAVPEDDGPDGDATSDG